MALGGSGRLQTTSLLEQLLEEINFQRTKEMRQLLKDESGFVVLQGTTYWTDLFVRHFLFQEEQAIDCDDLLFFVRKRHVKGSSRYLPKYETDVEVFRKDSKKLPIGDPEIDWEETVYLNLIVHQFDYTLTLAICTRTSPKELQVLKRHSQKVYASPSRRKMDTKGEGEEMTYPHICFMVDNFDEVFCDIVVRDGEMVCVELVARGRGAGPQAVIFLGSIRYDALTRVYDSRQSSLSTKVAARMSFGLLGGGTAARCEFVRMKGPCGKGHAEMAVSKPRGSGIETPCSEPGLCETDLWDSDYEEDPSDMFVYRHQRRLSDPSANLNNFVRGGWRTKDKSDKSRSENEGLDSLVSGIAEIEAGDLRDARRGCGSASSACCAPAPTPAPARMREVYTLARPDVSSPACLATVDPPRPAPPRLKPKHVLRPFAVLSPRRRKKTPKTNECEVADDAASLDECDITATTASPTRTIRSGEKTVRGAVETPNVNECGPKYTSAAQGKRKDSNGNRDVKTTDNKTADDAKDESGTDNSKSRWWGGARAFVTLPRRRLPPHRTTPDGTDIYYWCDMPKKKNNELDDGAYNPLWAMRGFTQTFHLWKEGRRAQCTPLNAYLTYVTLPWWSIAKDILDHREEPILTF